MFRSKVFFLVLIFSFCLIFSSCSEPQEVPNTEKSEWVGDTNPSATKLQQRGEQATRALGYQKEVKEKLAVELPIIETFTRETEEKDTVAKLGKFDTQKEVKLENVEQKVLYYNESGFAIWLWKDIENKGPYQYRATVSLKEGKFDVPIHNVFEEGEIRQVQNIFEEKK